MTSLIHPSSTISDSVLIGEKVKVGPFCNIEGNISIGDGTELKSHVSITGNTTICLLYTSPSPRDMRRSRMPSSA